MDTDVLLGRAAVFPLGDPLLEDLAGLSIGQGHLLDAIDFQGGPVKHLLNCSRRRFENRKGYELIKSEWLCWLPGQLQGESVEG